MFRSSLIHSLLTGIFRESLSDFRRNQFLSCAVFKVRRAVPASNCCRPSLPSGRPKNGLPSVPVRRRNRSEVSSGFLPRTLKTIQIRESVRRLGSAFASPQLYQLVLRSFDLPYSPDGPLSVHGLFISHFPFPISHSQMLDLRIRTKLSASYIAP